MNQINPNSWSHGSHGAKSMNNEKVEKTASVEKTEAKNQPGKTDTIEIGNNQEKPITYSNPIHTNKLDSSEVTSLKGQADLANENLRHLVETLILKQTKGFNGSQNATDQVDPKATAGVENKSDAALSISEDGEFGVKAVSDRIVDFAISLCGGDKTKLEEIITSIDKGFAAAKEVLGGSLPDICNKTYDAIMTKLDEWAKSN